MKIPFTLGRYLARTYILNTVFLLGILLSILYLFDTVELIRRASKTQDVPLGLVLQMGLLKLPKVGQVIIPFAILFSAMFTFWQLNRRSELIVLRSAGFSVWQFLGPIIGVAFLIGVFQVGLLNPIGALLVSKYEQLENRHLEQEDSEIAFLNESLWLRQGTDGRVLDGDDDVKNGYVIIFARNIQSPEAGKPWSLGNVTVFYFGQNDTFLMRLDSKAAYLEPKQWVFSGVTAHKQGSQVIERDQISLPTNLTVQDIEESFSAPETIPFWVLPAHIKTLEQTGFNVSRLQVYYYSLLSQPLYFVSMVLLAALVSMRPPRIGGTFGLLGAGVFIGFVVFFASSYLQAMGASQQIPAILAAWAPAVITLLLGLTGLIHYEDG